MAALRQVWTKWRPSYSPLIRQTGLRCSISTDAEKPEPPNGFLFNEKVILQIKVIFMLITAASSTWREETERGLGKTFCLWYGNKLCAFNCRSYMET